MSWSVYTVGLPSDIEGRVSTLEPPGEGTPEREDQVKVAKTVAVELVKSGAVGTGEAFTVALSGHANPEHKPTAGWTNDLITVSVTQTNAAAVEQYDTNQAAALAQEQ